MEPKDEPKKNSEEQKQISNEENEDNNHSSKTSENNKSNSNKSKNSNQFIKLELNKENFQIIQKKEDKKDLINDKNDSEIKLEPNNIINKQKALSDKNIIDIKNDQEKANKPLIKLEDFKAVKKSHSLDIREINYYRDNNNQNVYNLLNSYYKDIDLNFKNKNININNTGKNFLLKNNFKEQKDNNQNEVNPSSNPIPDYKINNINTNSSENNFQYNYPFVPYSYYQNPNNSYFYNFNNNQSSSNTFPENAFTINNQFNYNYSNNINYYNYNFHRNNKNKYSRGNYNYNDEYKLYLIDIVNIIKGIDNRTTIMIRHIPNRYTYQNLLDEINVVCKDKYDVLYLPIDSENNCNLGYAFINFINPLHIVLFYNVFKSRKWIYFNSFKECDLTYAKYQGKNELILNIEKNIGKRNDKKKIPKIFEIKNPPKIDLYKKYYEIIKIYKSDCLNDINWI